MTFLCAWVLLCPCGAYAFLGDVPLIAVIAAGVLLLSTIIRRPMALTVRTVVYSLTIASVVTVIDSSCRCRRRLFSVPDHCRCVRDVPAADTPGARHHPDVFGVRTDDPGQLSERPGQCPYGC